MKKLFLFFANFLLIFPFTKTVEAKSFSIDKVDVTAVVNSDGSMEVKEERSYNFSGSYSFAYQSIEALPDQENYSRKEKSLCFRRSQNL